MTKIGNEMLYDSPRVLLTKTLPKLLISIVVACSASTDALAQSYSICTNHQVHIADSRSEELRLQRVEHCTKFRPMLTGLYYSDYDVVYRGPYERVLAKQSLTTLYVHSGRHAKGPNRASGPNMVFRNEYNALGLSTDLMVMNLQSPNLSWWTDRNAWFKTSYNEDGAPLQWSLCNDVEQPIVHHQPFYNQDGTFDRIEITSGGDKRMLEATKIEQAHGRTTYLFSMEWLSKGGEVLPVISYTLDTIDQVEKLIEVGYHVAVEKPLVTKKFFYEESRMSAVEIRAGQEVYARVEFGYPKFDTKGNWSRRVGRLVKFKGEPTDRLLNEMRRSFTYEEDSLKLDEE